MLRSVKFVCSDRMRPSLSGTAAQMSGTPSECSVTYVARRPAVAFASRSFGRAGSSILTPGKFGRPDAS